MVPASPSQRYGVGDHHPSSLGSCRCRALATDRQRPTTGTLLFLFDPAPPRQCPGSERGIWLCAPPYLRGAVDRRPGLLAFTPQPGGRDNVSSPRAHHERPGRHRGKDARGEVSGVCGVPGTHQAIRPFSDLTACRTLSAALPALTNIERGKSAFTRHPAGCPRPGHRD